MRLSLTVSRKFFDLQDMLGFDKASKTIEWLFTKSKTAIKEHFTKNKPQMNSNAGKNAAAVSMFECYLAATGSEKTPARGETMVGSTTHAAHNSSSKKKNMNLRKASYNPLARESREKARARARERTKEKLKIKSLGTSNPKNMDDQLGFSGLVAAGEEEPSTCCHREKGSTIETVAQVQGDQLGPTDIIEKFLGTSSSLASCSIYDSRNNNSSNSNNNNFNGFLEDWNVDNAGMFYSDYYAIASKVSLGFFKESPSKYVIPWCKCQDLLDN